MLCQVILNIPAKVDSRWYNPDPRLETIEGDRLLDERKPSASLTEEIHLDG